MAQASLLSRRMSKGWKDHFKRFFRKEPKGFDIPRPLQTLQILDIQPLFKWMPFLNRLGNECIVSNGETIAQCHDQISNVRCRTVSDSKWASLYVVVFDSLQMSNRHKRKMLCFLASLLLVQHLWIRSVGQVFYGTLLLLQESLWNALELSVCLTWMYCQPSSFKEDGNVLASDLSRIPAALLRDGLEA